MLWSASSIGDSSWVALKSRSVSSSVLELLMSSPPDNILIQNRTSENIICMHFLIEWAISKTGPWRIFTRRKTATNKASFIKKLVNLKYMDDNSVEEYFTRSRILLTSICEGQPEQELQILLTLVVSLSNLAHDVRLIVNLVTGCLLNAEVRWRSSRLSQGETWLIASEDSHVYRRSIEKKISREVTIKEKYWALNVL